MIGKLIKNTDFILLGIVLILITIGIFGIYSANFNSDTGRDEYIKQLAWTGVGLVLCVGMWIIDHNNMGKIAFILTPIFIVLLIGVLFTEPIGNARSWYDIKIFLFQPAETFKIIYILVMGRIIEYISQKDSKGINRFVNLLLVLGLMASVFMLIAIQPDFGTAFVYIVVTAFMLFRSGLDYRYILVAAIIIAISVPIVYMCFLTDEQQTRIKVFLDPTLDPLGDGYHVSQSKIAIGSGMVNGTGYLNGTQTQYGFLPVKSSDFIFAVIAEEMGFRIGALIIILYGIMLIKMIYISMTAADFYGSLVVTGIFGMFFFHYIENIGMTMGLMPVTGIPLPFVSYGGSAMLTNMLALGIVLSVSARREKR